MLTIFRSLAWNFITGGTVMPFSGGWFPGGIRPGNMIWAAKAGTTGYPALPHQGSGIVSDPVHLSPHAYPFLSPGSYSQRH